MIMILPKPREATSVAIRIGALPVLNSKTRKMYFKYVTLLGKTTFVVHNNFEKHLPLNTCYSAILYRKQTNFGI